MNPLKQSMMSKRSVKSLMANKSRLTKKNRNRFLLLLKLHGKEWLSDGTYCDTCEFRKGYPIYIENICTFHERKGRDWNDIPVKLDGKKFNVCGDFKPGKQK